MSLQRDIDSSADASNKYLDQLWWAIARPGERPPKTLHERNMRLYQHFGRVVPRDAIAPRRVSGAA